MSRTRHSGAERVEPPPAALAPTIVALALGIVVLALRRRFSVVTIAGESMHPALPNGSQVLLRRSRDVRVGDVVVFTAPARADRAITASFLYAKRVVALPGDPLTDSSQCPQYWVPPGHVWVRGDGAGSYDSRRFGPLPLSNVVGICARRLATSAPSSPALPAP